MNALDGCVDFTDLFYGCQVDASRLLSRLKSLRKVCKDVNKKKAGEYLIADPFDAAGFLAVGSKSIDR